MSHVARHGQCTGQASDGCDHARDGDHRYGAGAPAATFEHLESYLRSVFGLIGVTGLQMIVAEGLQAGAEQRDKSMQDALQAAGALQAA
jgi:FMN-dependent NADH-azoreductase